MPRQPRYLLPGFPQHVINRKYERTGTLWEGRYRASLVNSDEYLLCCYRYIELNPVRARLVNNPSAYRWSSYRHHALGQFDRVVTHHEAYQDLGPDVSSRQRVYRSLVQAELDSQTLSRIRESADGNLVLGNEAFKDQIETVLNRPVRHKKSGRPRKTCL